MASDIEALLERAEEENRNLRQQIGEMQDTIEWQAKVIREYAERKLESRKAEMKAADADRQLFTMMKERPELSEGAVHVTIPVDGYIDTAEEEIDDLPETNEENRMAKLAGWIMLIDIAALMAAAFIWFQYFK